MTEDIGPEKFDDGPLNETPLGTAHYVQQHVPLRRLAEVFKARTGQTLLQLPTEGITSFGLVGEESGELLATFWAPKSIVTWM